MKNIKTASLAITSGLLMIWTASTPAWAATTGSQSINADVASANGSGSARDSRHNWLEPSTANAQPKSATCKPGRIFSQHDVVGDPESCIIQGGGYALGARAVVTSAGL
jgi:hypothetical protein